MDQTSNQNNNSVLQFYLNLKVVRINVIDIFVIIVLNSAPLYLVKYLFEELGVLTFTFLVCVRMFNLIHGVIYIFLLLRCLLYVQ